MATTMRWFKGLLKRKLEEQSQLLRERIAEARIEVRLTQVAAATKMGHDQTFISKIEAGTRNISFVEMEQLARNYGKPLSYFETIYKVEQDNPEFNVGSIGAVHSRNIERRSRNKKATTKRQPSPSRPKSAKGR